jgi:hypothetical protein
MSFPFFTGSCPIDALTFLRENIGYFATLCVFDPLHFISLRTSEEQKQRAHK